MKRALIAAALFIAGIGSVRALPQQIARESWPPARTAVAAAAVEPPAPAYLIGADDLLSVVFWRDDKLSGEVLVRPDGKISVPLLDDVQAEGLTPEQLRDRLVADARRFVADPVVTVVVKQINSRKVYITGLVGKPGQYPLTRAMTVLQLIATAGGLLDFAKAKEIRVVRSEHGQSVSLRFDELLKYPERTSRNLELRPGDTVIIP
jgi:polysaccharide biosynthesis/export protein